ncbi:MAG: mycofactocin-associated electron transfer flavoprotein beta subunit [Acidimicrobiia bacterium]|nr:mycofactocin-associated electron transfer flavoprotein beta subunit [Acidimicrobiia bacterium]
MADVLVCLKWVDLRPEIDPLTGAISSDVRFSGAGPADLSALEWGLRIATASGGTVTAATSGPPAAEGMLRDALAAGATRAVLVEGRGDESSNEVAGRLAPLAAEIDIVCCGVHSLDRGSGSVPAFLANQLGLPQALGLVTARATDTADDGPELIVERRLDQGRRERLAVTGRCVLSFESGPELRRAALAATLASSTASVERLIAAVGPSAAEPTVVERGPYRPRPKVEPAPAGSTRSRVAALIGTDSSTGSAQVHELAPADAAQLVADQLVNWGYLAEADPLDSGTPPGGDDGGQETAASS